MTEVNRWSKPLQSSTDSNLVDVGRYSAGQVVSHDLTASHVLRPMGVWRLRGKLRYTRSDAVGVKPGSRAFMAEISPSIRCRMDETCESIWLTRSGRSRKAFGVCLCDRVLELRSLVRMQGALVARVRCRWLKGPHSSTTGAWPGFEGRKLEAIHPRRKTSAVSHGRATAARRFSETWLRPSTGCAVVG